MKKLLIIFLLGQLLLLSYIFNKSVYAIYELNNLGDTSLTSFLPDDASGDTLRKLYDRINELCLESNDCSLQVIKNPISEKNKLIYDIYHSDIGAVDEIQTISTDKEFNYFQLQKVDFVDNDGTFYSDITPSTINQIEKELDIKITPITNSIDYKQIITYNLLNFIILLIVSQLVLFIYTFTRIKVNTVKKVLGFSPFKMVVDSLRTFLYIEFVAVFITLIVHYVFYYFSNQIVARYFLLLSLFLVLMVVLNILMLLVTQISLKFIDINIMIKNKTFSNRLNYGLYTIKIILILTITISMSIFINNYQDYLKKTENFKIYEILGDYYTSNGYNSVQDQIAKNNKNLLQDYGEKILELYDHYNREGVLFTHDVTTNINYIKGTFIDDKFKLEDFYNNVELNYIVVNQNFLKKFQPNSGIDLGNINPQDPTILVPNQYKEKEKDIKEIYTEKFNNFLTYNLYFDIETKNKLINNVNILYIENDINYELLGKNVTTFGEVEVKNPIVVLDEGNFDSLYYYDKLNQGNLVFHLQDRNEFTKIVHEYELSDLVIAGTLITPFLKGIHNAEFVLYNSLVFTLLFLFTLLFFIYISNYVDVVSNSKKYAVLYVHGFDTFSIFKTQLILLLSLLSGVLISLLTEFNILFYILILIVDLLVLLLLYNKIIKQNIHNILKGGW